MFFIVIVRNHIPESHILKSSHVFYKFQVIFGVCLVYMFFAFILHEVSFHIKLMQLSKDLDHKAFCSNSQSQSKDKF
jgi:hypothetical protein